MNKGILIAGNESVLTKAITAEAAGLYADRYVFTFIGNRFGGSDISNQQRENTSSGAFIPEWNPGSPVSARTLVLAAENRLGRIDKAILVCDPPYAERSLINLNFADVEIMANDHIKGWFYLAKELAVIFRERSEGTIALVSPAENPGTGKENHDLLSHAILAAFRSLTGGLLAASEPFLTMGFSGGESGDEAGFAAFIFKQLEEGNRRSGGKLFKYGKLNLFK